MTNTTIIEWAPFNVASHVTDEQLLAAAEKVEQEFLQQYDGYIRRELLKGKDKQWVDLVYWKNHEAAQAAMQGFMDSPACAAYFALMVDMEEAAVAHYQQYKVWN